MRKVIYSEYEKRIEEPKIGAFELIEKWEATFLEFGIDYQELLNGVGNYSTAIIELSDGSIKNIPVEQVRFI